ncbi:MAG: hypothetical protein AB1610_03230 [Nitrospirota bacterium]
MYHRFPTTIILSLIILGILLTSSHAKEVPFTQEDRDRLIRLETKLEEGHKSLQKQFDDGQRSLQMQIDDVKTFMLWGFGILFGGMGILIGFVIWDRRTALSPVLRKTGELEEREDKIEKALKELAAKDPKVAEALKHVGLL